MKTRLPRLSSPHQSAVAATALRGGQLCWGGANVENNTSWSSGCWFKFTVRGFFIQEGGLSTLIGSGEWRDLGHPNTCPLTLTCPLTCPLTLAP